MNMGICWYKNIVLIKRNTTKFVSLILELPTGRYGFYKTAIFSGKVRKKRENRGVEQ